MILFKVIAEVGGHEYVIHDDGRIEGFGDAAIVCNYYPVLRDAAVAKYRLQCCEKGEKQLVGITQKGIGVNDLSP